VTATITLIETGSVAKNYTLDNGDFSKVATLNKATVSTGLNLTVEALENLVSTYTVDLETLLPAITGTFGQLTYSIHNVDNTDGVLDALNYSSGTSLELPVNAVASNKLAVVTIRVVSENYADFFATITLATTTRIPVSISLTMAGGIYNAHPYAYAGTPLITNDITHATVTGLTLNALYESTDGGTYSSMDAPVDAGAYRLTLSVPEDHPEYFGSEAFDFTITQRPIQLIADDKTITLGESLPAFTYTVSGVLTGQTPFTGEPLLSSPSANPSAAGDYPIIIDLTGVTAMPNYLFSTPSTVAGTLRVEAILPVVIHVNGISLNASQAEIERGATCQFTAYVSPTDATNRDVLWSSSDGSIATVSANGEVAGMAVGTATITATTTDGGHTASCAVTVVTPVGVELIPAEIEVVFEQSTLRITSPSEEVIAVYSFNGQLLFKDKKTAGETLFPTPNHLNEKLLIVTGNSGWVKKVNRNN
jgi:hypothetical protein